MPYAHVESSHFKKFNTRLLPVINAYLQMCMLITDILFKTSSRFAITFDGWSSNSLKGFYLVMFHWVCHETLN